MIENEILENLKKQLKEEVMVEIMTEMAKSKQIKILDREDMMKIFNCGRTKMNAIMHSEEKPPVVYIGGEYYSTERQMKAYFNSKTGYKKTIVKYNKQQELYDGLNLFYKEDLMNMFKMGRTKFKKFIDSEQSPIKTVGTECYVTSEKLQEWFDKFEGKKINID